MHRYPDCRIILKLLDYIEKTRLRDPNHYKYSFNFFCIHHNFGYSAKKKLEAAEVFMDVLLSEADASVLDYYYGELHNGELGGIFREFEHLIKPGFSLCFG